MADKEVLLTALNVKAMSFSEDEEDLNLEGQSSEQKESRAIELKHQESIQRKNSILGDLLADSPREDGRVPIILDLAFASNVR